MSRASVVKPWAGVFGMIICVDANATDEQILAECNEQNPSGTSRGWTRVVRDEPAPRGPVACADRPDRIHFIVEC